LNQGDRRERTLIRLFRPVPREPFVDRLPALKSGLDRVPVRDSGFAHLPTKQNDLFAKLAGKVQKPRIEILDLDPDGIDLLHRILDLLNRGL
jgi:hypothetical protein